MAGIVYLADNDQVGRLKAEKCAEAAAAVGLPLVVVYAGDVLEGLPAGGSIDDVEDVGANFRDDVPVLMNLQGASETVAKRLLDFASGLIYGLDGSIERTGERIFLLTPSDVEVSGEETARLRERGLVS